MRIKKTTKRQLQLQIAAYRNNMAKFRKRGYHAQYRYARNWLKMHTQLLKP